MTRTSTRASLTFATALLVAVAFGAIPASAVESRANGIIVALDASVTSRQAEAAVDAVGGRVIHATVQPRSMLVSVPSGADVEKIASVVSRMPGVRYAEPNGRVRALAVPNDSYYSLQWGLGAVNAPVAWDGARGSSSVKVAVIDSGVYFAHPDLAGVLDSAQDYDYVNRDTDASDDNGHGTHVTGLVAAIANNKIGVAGLAGFGPSGTSGGVRVLPIKVLDENGDGWDEDVALAIRRAADSGARVINLSMGGSGSTSLSEAVVYARAKGCVLVAAAGNSGLDQVLYPAGSPGVIGVGSVDSELRQAMFSNSGAHVDVVAPGEQVFSTSWPGAFGSGGELYGYMSGTSMATPIVAAEAALLFSAMPGATGAQVENAIISSARDLGPVGRDDDYGRGVIDAAAALSRLIGYDYQPPVTTAAGIPVGWSSARVVVTLTATDDVSGVARIQYAVGDGPLVNYTGPFTVEAQGVTKIAFSSVDKAGNREQTRVATVRIDGTPPVTTTQVAGTYVGSAQIVLSPSDGLSGVAKTRWVLDGVEGSGTTVSVSTRGFHTLTYGSTDAAGNVEESKSAAFFVLSQAGEVPPLTTAALGIASGWSSKPETIAFVSAGGDGTLPTSIWYSLNGENIRLYTGPFVVSREGTTTILFASSDGGTPETTKRTVVRIDSTAPTLTVDAKPAYPDAAAVSAVASDSLSGLDADSLAWSINGGKTWTRGLTTALSAPGRYEVLFRAADVAGNETRVTARFTITGASAATMIRPTVIAPAWGVPATLQGAVLPAPSGAATVTIQARAYGATRWSTIARALTGAGGTFVARVMPQLRTEYRAVFGGDGVLRPSVPSNSVLLKPRVSLMAASGVSTIAQAGTRLKLSGRVVPAHTTGVFVVAERKSGSTWIGRQSTQVTLVGDGHGGSRWRASLALPRGTWRVRVYHPGDVLHSATYSASRYVTVR